MTISRHERLELYHLSLAFLLSAELEVFGPLDGALKIYTVNKLQSELIHFSIT